MKLFIFILTYVFLIGCNTDEENPVSGNVYVFKSVPDLPISYEEKIIFEYLAFIDGESFILSYSESYRHKFVRGNYQVEDDYVHLEFENHSYYVSYPEIPATSAVDTMVYEPLISESPWNYPELKMKLSIDAESIRLDKTGMDQMGEINADVSLNDFRNGIKIQSLDFLLETETIIIK